MSRSRHSWLLGLGALALCWVVLLFLVATHATAPPIGTLDSLAQKRDVEGLDRFLPSDFSKARSPFRVLRTGGAYDVGRFGWRAVPLGDRYVVLSTPLTSEDVGEILLRREGDALRPVPESDDLGVRVVRHSLEVRLDVPKKRADIVDTVQLRSEGTGEFVFRMSPAYRVSAITDETGKSVSFRQGGGVVLLNKGPKAITVRYGGIVDLPLYAGSISSREATLVNDYWYPMIARKPAPYDLTLHAPKDWSTVGQGERVSDDVTPTERVTKFRMDLPVVFYSVSAGPYRIVEQTIGGRTFRVWSPRLSEEQMRIQTELYAPILDFYSKTFGPFPFEGYGALDSPGYGGGALEAYSYATYGGGLPEEDAHEPSHTWWGGIINNTYLGSFWNESFAVFSEGLYRREVPIGDHGERRQAFASKGAAEGDYGDVAIANGGADAGPVASSLGYGKGAKVLGMLEQWLGTDAIEADMREWIVTQPKGIPGDWPDFERIVTKNALGKDVKGFFDDWIRRPGVAHFDATATYREGAIRLSLNWNGPRYRMPLTVMRQSVAGVRTYDTIFVSGDAVEIPAAERPALVSLDPWAQTVRDVAANEVPVSLKGTVGSLTRIVDPAHRDWMTFYGPHAEATDAGVAGKFIVGSPETLPLMRPLCAKAGFTVSGETLTYRGTAIDLRRGGALAVVDLDGGRRCVIGLGKLRHAPNPGAARTALFDDLGRFLRGDTEPKTSGKMTFKW